MKKITITYPLTPEQIELFRKPQVMALGYFDGVHLGHQEVIGRAVAYAREHHIPASVMTFHPKPREVLLKEEHSSYLTPMETKMKVMAELGVEQLFVVRFDETFSQISPAAFVKDILFMMDVQHVVVGFDYAFGFRGEGNPQLLQELGAERMTVEVVEPCRLREAKISSTLIRASLTEGQVKQANELLGRPYEICGTVVPGEGRGNTIGFPTANIEPDDEYIIPRNGVYAVHLYLGNERFGAVMNIGVKPTFHKDGSMKQTLEAHIFDFSRNIYNQQVRIEFIDYLRPEQRFSSVNDLITQIHRDAERAQALTATI